MEGPSLVIATEEFEPFLKTKITQAKGTARLDYKKLKGNSLIEVRSWGKHFLLIFKGLSLRIHFLMFGSYRINSERANRDPKLTLKLESGDVIHFYSCAIKEIEGDLDELYDWSIDIMSDQWDSRKAVKQIQGRPDEMVCDVLMDQSVFAGLGNIIKNEVLFRLRLHPETLVKDQSNAEIKALVKEARAYSLQFYKWKKKNELKRNWQIFRKKVCPRDGSTVIKRKTGALERVSFYCENCQKNHEDLESSVPTTPKKKSRKRDPASLTLNS